MSAPGRPGRESGHQRAGRSRSATLIDRCAAAGFTFYTIDPGEYVDPTADRGDATTLRERYMALPWAQLDSSPSALAERYAGRRFDLADRALSLDELPQLFNVVKDPHEMHELIGEAAYAGLADDMEARLRSIGDPEQIDAQAKALQETILNTHGGREHVLREFKPVVYSPAPVAAEQEDSGQQT